MYTLLTALILLLSPSIAFTASRLTQTHRGVPRNAMSMTLPAVSKSKILIVQNKGGGHGEIGYQLCKTLKGLSPTAEVVLLQDECDYKKLPFASYEKDLAEALGVKVISEKLASSTPGALLGMKFDYVIDNWSKSVENAALVMDIAKSSEAKQHVFISSAGMYKSSGKMPIEETDPVKENDARKIELAVMKGDVPFTFLRPQYIYGPKANKRYLDYFIGRAARKLPIPLPLHGEQLVCISHIEDVCSLIAAAVGADKALNEVFNCGTNRFISYKGLSDIIHTTLENDLEADAKYLFYEPDDFNHWDGSGAMEFPFRRDTFIINTNKAVTTLGWSPKRSILADVKEQVSLYKEAGGLKSHWGLQELRYDLEVIASKDSTFMFTYPFFDSSDINTESMPYLFQSSSEFVERP